MNKNSTSKQLMFVLIVILVCIVFYLLVRNNTNILHDKQTITTPKQGVTEEEVTTSPKVVDKNTEKPSLPTESLAWAEIEIYRGLCGVSFGSEKIEKLKKLENKSQQQLEALDRILNKCEPWYDYWASLSESQQNAKTKEIEDNQGLDSYFRTAAFREKDKSVLDEAKAIVATGGDGSPLSSAALLYMLRMDAKLSIEIGKRLNVKYPITTRRYIKDSATNIARLYSCTANPTSSCRGDSIEFDYLCVTGLGDLCNIPLEQRIASMTTANQFADLQQMVAIIRSLVAEGYFD